MYFDVDVDDIDDDELEVKTEDGCLVKELVVLGVLELLLTMVLSIFK